MAGEKLKPCPFCGERERLALSGADPAPGCLVVCFNCDAEGPITGTRDGDFVEKDVVLDTAGPGAIAAWNKRAPDDSNG